MHSHLQRGLNTQTKSYDKGGSFFGCREGSFFDCHLHWTDLYAFQRMIHLVWNSRFSDEDKFWRFYFMLTKVGMSVDWLIDPIPDGVSAGHFTRMYGRLTSDNNWKDLLSAWAKGFSDLELYFMESL
ncbi:MAG TPA: hypothetical protein VIN67_07610 [Desulfobaccales bacterium]